MHSNIASLNGLNRPKILIKAARAGQRALLNASCQVGSDPKRPDSNQRFNQLYFEEQTLDEERKAQDAGYSVRKHINTLSKLMVEAERLRRVDMAA